MSASSLRGLLFTDIEGSTALVRRLGARYQGVLERHQAIVRAAVAERGGAEESREGDSLFVTFPSATDALDGAVDAQRQIELERWPSDGRVRVRMGVHVGEVMESRAGLVGFSIHVAARITGSGHGGQIVVSGDVVRQLTTVPADVTLRSLGTCELRDVGALELYQVDHPDLQDEFPALRTVQRRVALGRSNLPAPVSPIIGRDRELSAVDLLRLADRLVTLVGVGGIGKTRLAVEIAAHTVGRCEFGPFFVDLAPVGDFELVPAALAGALGVEVEPGGDVTAAIQSGLGDHQVVVVLDNCEHLLPGMASLVAGLLASSPGVRVLATSREPLGVAGERVFPVDPLRRPAVDASLEQLEDSDAGALFLARVTRSLSTGPLRADEVGAVVSICRRLEGVPLGLELAAARSRALSLPELAKRLERSIDDLALTGHGVLSRHRTMAAALDWGYALLTPPAQTALQAMSLFAGGCDRDAFATVCLVDGGPAAADVLDELIRTSFVTADFAGETTRYRMLEPVRQHARRLLGDANATEVQRRHLNYFVALVRGYTGDVDAPGVASNTAILQSELGNFRVALDWAAADPDGVEAGLWLVAHLHQLWTSGAHHQEGLARSLGLLGCGGSAPARSEAAYCAGFIAFDVGDNHLSDELFERALTEAQTGGDRVGEVRARRVLSECAVNCGDFATARRHLETAIPIAIAEGNDLLHAHCVAALAQLLCAAGDLDEAERRVGEMLEESVGADSSIDIWMDGELGRIMFERGDYARARACNERIVDFFGSQPSVNLVMHARLDLAKIEVAAGNVDAAAAQLALAEELRPDSSGGWDPYLALARADLALLRGDWAGALIHAQHANELTDETVDALVQCDVLRILGDAQLALGCPNDALVTYERLIEVAGAASFRCRLAEGHEGAAAAASVLDRLAPARDHLTKATDIRQHTRARRVQRPTIDQHLVPVESDRQFAAVRRGFTSRDLGD